MITPSQRQQIEELFDDLLVEYINTFSYTDTSKIENNYTKKLKKILDEMENNSD